MPVMELKPTPFDPALDSLSSKIQQIRARKEGPAATNGKTVEASMDSAMDVVGSNLGRKEARGATDTMQSLSMEMVQQGAEAHFLDPAVVADLIADPFED